MWNLKDLQDAENGKVKRENGEEAGLSDQAGILDRGSSRSSGQAGDEFQNGREERTGD